MASRLGRPMARAVAPDGILITTGCGQRDFRWLCWKTIDDAQTQADDETDPDYYGNNTNINKKEQDHRPGTSRRLSRKQF